MTKKKAKTPDSHDACVREIAEELKKDKWEVKAESGRLGKALPDQRKISSRHRSQKGCFSRICEVATEEMFRATRNGT